jgi:mRNA interferase MazF
VWWFEPDPVRGSEQAGRRPAIVVTRDVINRVSPVVIVVPLTTYRRQTLYPSDVLICSPDGGLGQDSVAMALHIRAIDRARLSAPIGQIAPESLQKVEEAILQVLDIRARM